MKRMTRALALWSMLLLGACATTAPLAPEYDEPLEATSSWEEAWADPSCVVPLCDEERCAPWRRGDVLGEGTHRVVLTRAPLAQRPPLVGSPLRWWGHPLAAPTTSEPIFEIPWNNWKSRSRLTYKESLFVCTPPREPLEKHHIFPQEKDLAEWFKVKRIDIHAFTIRLPRSYHSWLHSYGPRGGQWNAAWRVPGRQSRSQPGANLDIRAAAHDALPGQRSARALLLSMMQDFACAISESDKTRQLRTRASLMAHTPGGSQASSARPARRPGVLAPRHTPRWT